MTPSIALATTRVLIVEDNPVDVDLLRISISQLHDWPVETTVVTDGEKAIQLLREKAGDRANQPDLILLDLNLPCRDGTEVLQVIRSTAGLRQLLVAVLSSSPYDVIQTKLTDAGVVADGHFTKPFDFDEFLQLGPVLQNWYETQQRKRT